MYHCPFVRRARLISYKALALFGFVLAAMLLPHRPAAAQGQGQPAGWDIVYSQNGSDGFTGNGSASGSPYAWGTNNDNYLMGGFAVSATPGTSASITGSGTIVATLTWNAHGTGQPAPPISGCMSPPPPASATALPPAWPMMASRTRSRTASPKGRTSSGRLPSPAGY